MIHTFPFAIQNLYFTYTPLNIQLKVWGGVNGGTKGTDELFVSMGSIKISPSFEVPPFREFYK